MINIAPFSQTPMTQTVVVTAALAGIATGAVTGVSLVMTATVGGAMVTRLTVKPRGSNAASSLVLFLVKASAPSLFLPIDSVLLPAAASTPIEFDRISNQTPMFLEVGDSLYVGCEVAQSAGVAFRAEWRIGVAIGSVEYFASNPGDSYLLADGGVFSQVAYPELFSKVGFLGSINESSPVLETLPTNLRWQSIAYGNGVFVAIAFASAIAATSPDGVNWTLRDLPISRNWGTIIFANGIFFAIVNGSNITATSTDGITWTQGAVTRVLPWSAVAYGNGLFFAVASGSSSYRAASSPDGINWTERILPTSSTWQSIAYGNGIFVAVSSDTGTGLISPDGLTWTAVTLPVAYWRTIVFGNGVFVVVGDSGTVATSTDGITWTTHALPGATQWMALAFGDGVFMAVSSNSAVAATSTDGITWTQKNLPTTANLVAATYGNKRFVAVAASGIEAMMLPRYGYDTAVNFAVPDIPAQGDKLAYIRAN